MSNPFVHVELNTGDVAKAKTFYGSLFGWNLQDMPMPGGGSYTMIGVGDGVGGGMLSMLPAGTPPHWLAYVGVDDIEAKTKLAKELGATILHDITKVGDFGSMSVIQDPTGAVIAMWQGTSH